ncbi:MAG: hypothetical protein RL148_1836 [Planctomycetota bacterium]|jgi:tetratricopeptide (TPR) repeat protein
MRALLVLCLGLLQAACAVRMPAVPVRSFTDGDLERVQKFATEQVAEGPEENLALVLNLQAQCELLRGDLPAAARHFETAARLMGTWATSGSETLGAVVGSESSKTWRGDPYEKAMNAFYLGMTYLWRNEPDNARAAFKKGILADGESNDEKFQADFTLMFWLAGRMSRLMGLESDAKDFFREAREANQFCLEHGSRGTRDNPLLADPERGNLVLLVECGMGPEKYAAGSERELTRFRSPWHPALSARVHLGDRLLGTTSILADVDYQARTRGGTEMEGIRKGKAVFKSVARAAGQTALILGALDDSDKGRRDKLIVGGALLLASVLTSTEADTRCWSTLPATVQGLCAEVPPGTHQLRVEFLGTGGQVLDSLTQTWTVTVPESGESWYLFRSIPGLDRSRVVADATPKAMP